MKKIKLSTKRLIIELMENDEINILISNTEDEHLKNAYMEMLIKCKEDMDHRIWYAP